MWLVGGRWRGLGGCYWLGATPPMPDSCTSMAGRESYRVGACRMMPAVPTKQHSTLATVNTSSIFTLIFFPLIQIFFRLFKYCVSAISMSKLRDDTRSRTGQDGARDTNTNVPGHGAYPDYPEAICCVDIRLGPRPARLVATLLHYLHHTPAPRKMLSDYTICCVKMLNTKPSLILSRNILYTIVYI